MICEIYALLDPITKRERYIGKANNSALRLRGHLKDSLKRNNPLHQWIRELATKDLIPELKIIKRTRNWQAAERRQILISHAKNPDLLNVAPGGNAPYCPPEVAAENGRKNARAVHDNPERKRIWRLKQALSIAYSKGYCNDYVKEVMRYAAKKRPELFGLWATIT